MGFKYNENYDTIINKVYESVDYPLLLYAQCTEYFINVQLRRSCMFYVYFIYYVCTEVQVVVEKCNPMCIY